MKLKKYYTNDVEITAMQEELEHARELLVHVNDSYKKKKIFKIILNVCSFTIIAALLYIFIQVNAARANGETPTIFGYQVYEVKSGSMDPTLPVHSLILSKQVHEVEDIQVGDIITFVHNDITITHRVIDLVEEAGEIKYQTKGDSAANSIDADLIPLEEVKAKFIVKLPFYISTNDDIAGGGTSE